MADYTIKKCFLNVNKFKIYEHFFRIPNKTNTTEHCICFLLRFIMNQLRSKKIPTVLFIEGKSKTSCTIYHEYKTITLTVFNKLSVLKTWHDTSRKQQNKKIWSECAAACSAWNAILQKYYSPPALKLWTQYY